MEQQGTQYDLALAGNQAEHSGNMENAGLAVLFRYVRRYFDGLADTDDLDILVFALNYFYCSLDTLYRLALPDLASSPAWGAEEVGKIERAWGAAEAALSHGSFDITDLQTVHTMRDAVDELIQRHHHWMQLQAIQQVLERLASLSLLLCTTVGNLLEALDLHANELLAARQESAAEQQKQVGFQELRGSGEQKVAERQERQPYEQYLQHLAEQEHWDEAVKQLTDTLSDWQRGQHQQRTFKTVFAGLQRHTAALDELDSGFDLLLDYAASIFGEILLDFQAVTRDDDETVATLLLDLLQKIDQARLQLSLLQSGLSGLMKRTNMKSS